MASALPDTRPTHRRPHDRGVLARATGVFARPGGSRVEVQHMCELRYTTFFGSDTILKIPSCAIPHGDVATTEHMLGRIRRVAAWRELYARMALTSVCILPEQGRYNRRRRGGCEQGFDVTSNMLRVTGMLIPCRGRMRTRCPIHGSSPHASLFPAAVRAGWGRRTRCLSHLEQNLLRCCPGCGKNSRNRTWLGCKGGRRQRGRLQSHIRRQLDGGWPDVVICGLGTRMQSFAGADGHPMGTFCWPAHLRPLATYPSSAGR